MLVVYEKPGKGKEYNNKLRVKGRIPAVVYGKGLNETIPVELDPKDFIKEITNPKKYNSTFDVEVNRLDGTKVTKRVLIKHVQKHPFKTEYVHLDLYSYDPEEKQTFKINFSVTGKCEGVVAGGRLKVALRKLKIMAKPDSVPVEVIVDITTLQRGQVIRVKDLKLPEGVKAMYIDNQALVSVSALKLGPGGVEKKEELVFDW